MAPVLRVLVIGDKPLQGQEKLGLLHALNYAEIPNHVVRFTSLMKFETKADAAPILITPTLPFMRWEIKILKPKLIIPIGRYSTWVHLHQTHTPEMDGRVWQTKDGAVMPLPMPIRRLSYSRSGSTPSPILTNYRRYTAALRTLLVPSASN